MRERRGIFFTSDWHIGHSKVLEYSKRPFKDVAHMRETLVNNYNATVSHDDDVVYFLGDMGMCSGRELKDTLARLRGTKVLVQGNHDKGTEAMYRLGFDVVLYGAQLFVAGHVVTMTHCPLLGIWREDVSQMESGKGTNWHGDHKNQRFSTVDRGQFHLHGHVHSPNGGKSKRILDRQFDVGVDANNYRPVSVSQIESWIAKYGR